MAKKAKAAKKAKTVKERDKKRNAAKALRAADVDQPTAGSWVLAHPGAPPQIKVETSGWDVGDRVWAKVHSVAEAPMPTDPIADPEGFTELLEADYWDGFVDIPTNVPCAITRPTANNIAVTIVYVEFGGATTVQLLKRVQFKYICPTYNELVPAHACPWFAFRQDDDGPEGEDILTHRPIRVRIPENAATVSITASGWWRHQAIDANGDAGGSDPGGLGGAQPLANDRYRTESNNSTSHPPIELPDAPMPPVNLLVGVLDLKDPAAQATKVLKLGKGPTALPAPSDSFAIFLGMWDGRQWNKGADAFSISNSGEVTAIFNWAP